MTAWAKGAAARVAGDAPRRAAVLAAAVVCLLLAVKVTETAGWYQVPWVAALFVLPLLYVFTGPRRLMDRYRWPVLAVQATLTWVPLAVFGARWPTGFAGLLAGLVLLTVRGRVSWLAAGLLLAADLVVRAAVTGMPMTPAGSGGCG